MFEEEALRWEETGELQGDCARPYGALRLDCWIRSKGAQQDGVSYRLKRYCEAADEALQRSNPDWYDDFLSIKDSCMCGETFRYENLSLCTHCYVSLGYCHQFSGGLAANGNPKCPVCEMGEIVG